MHTRQQRCVQTERPVAVGRNIVMSTSKVFPGSLLAELCKLCLDVFRDLMGKTCCPRLCFSLSSVLTKILMLLAWAPPLRNMRPVPKREKINTATARKTL